MSDAFEKVIYNGKLMDKKTRAFVQACEEALGYPLTITQGCYSGGAVSQSGNTHNGGGVLDLPAWDWESKLRVIKDLGGWGWYRPTVYGLWNEHIHFGITNHGNLDPSAQRQQVAYFNRKNGLVSNLPDLSYRAKPVPIFQYPPKKPVKPMPRLSRKQKSINALVEGIHSLGEARALLAGAPATRPRLQAKAREIGVEIRDLREILVELKK